MTRRLGKATVELRGQAVVFVLFSDGRATCEHVAAGAVSVSSGNGHISARKHRAEPFTIHRCASCDRRFGPTREAPVAASRHAGTAGRIART